MSETATNRRPDYAPHGESGFDHKDVLAQAEEGDVVIIEFDLAGESGIYGVRGEVSVHNTWMCEDGRTEGHAYYLNCEHERINHLRIRMLSDTISATKVLKDEIGIKWYGRDLRDDRELGDVHTVEVYKDGD